MNVRQPSVVQMLHKLNGINLVEYSKGNSVMKLTAEGEQIGERMIRNTGLLEVMMKEAQELKLMKRWYAE